MLFFYQGYSSVPCIYEIRNTQTNRRYVGQTTNPKLRWGSGHKRSLMAGTHRNQFLQNDYNKCFAATGNTDFLEFHIIELLPGSKPEQRDERECYWIEERAKIHELYNLTTGGNANKRVSESTKEKLSTSRKGKSYEEQYGVERAKEIREKIRENKLVEMNKPDVKENLRQQLTGKTSVERYGEAKAAEVKRKQSLSRKGKYTGQESSRYKILKDIQLCSPDGMIYTNIEGIKEFAEKHGLSKNHLSELLSGKRKTHHGWHLVNTKGNNS